MDWLDQYLNGLGEYKTTVSPADTHMWGVKPKLNNVQERMQFDAAAQSEAEFRQLVQEARAELEEHGMSRDDVAEGIGADPGSNIFSAILSFQVNANNQSLVLPGNASIFEFTVGNAVSSFNLDIVGFGSFSVLNNYDENNFSNCYLSAFNLNNITISFNPVFVTASESLCSNGQLFTIYYSNTGSAIFSITKSDTLEPAPSPTPTRTPAVTVTPTISITPTRTSTPTVTPTTTVTPTISITPTKTPTPTVTPTPTPAPAGINPATPTNLSITFADQVNGTYGRNVAGVHTTWNQFIDGGEECKLEWTGTIWRLRRIANGEFGGPYVGEATNDTGNVNLIPTTGWVYTITDYGSPTVTITAA